MSDAPVQSAGVVRERRGDPRLRSAFDDAASVKDHDLVRIGDGGEAVRDDQRRAPAARRLERILHFRFGCAVERRCGFVQNEDGRIF